MAVSQTGYMHQKFEVTGELHDAELDADELEEDELAAGAPKRRRPSVRRRMGGPLLDCCCVIGALLSHI